MVFAVQGDNIFNVDLKRFRDFHIDKKAVLTIGLREVEDVTGFGVADLDENMKILKFAEKPKKEEAPSNLVNTGLYMFSKEIRNILREEGIEELLKEKRRLDFGYDIIPYLIKTGRPVYGFIIKGGWYDVGTPAHYLEAMMEILQGNLSSLQDFGGRISQNRRIWVQGESLESMKRRARIIKKYSEKKIRFEGAVLIGRHCQIEDGATIINSCIDNYCRIGKNVIVENSAIMDRGIIGDGANIKRSIIGRQVTVKSTLKNPSTIEKFSVIADDVIVSAGCQLSEVKVYPHLNLPKGDFKKQTIHDILVT
jgi:NDP-sugar pyrophosphorylase family protein